jgi:hypothetical protein
MRAFVNRWCIGFTISENADTGWLALVGILETAHLATSPHLTAFCSELCAA